MFSSLSYFNIFYSVVYAIVYLRNATFTSFVGMALIILFNWLALLAFQKDEYRWKWHHFAVASVVIYYIGFFAYGWYNILNGIIEAEFLSNDSLFYLISTALLCVAVVFHLVQFFRMNLRERG